MAHHHHPPHALPASSLGVVGAFIEATTGETSSDGKARIPRDDAAQRFADAVREVMTASLQPKSLDVDTLRVHGGLRVDGTAVFDKRVHMRCGFVAHEHVRMPGIIASKPPRGVARPGQILLVGRCLYIGMESGQWGTVMLGCCDCFDDDGYVYCSDSDGNAGNCDEKDFGVEGCSSNSSTNHGGDGTTSEAGCSDTCAETVIHYDASWEDEGSAANLSRLPLGALVVRNGQVFRTQREMAKWEFSALSLCVSHNNGLELL